MTMSDIFYFLGGGISDINARDVGKHHDYTPLARALVSHPSCTGRTAHGHGHGTWANRGWDIVVVLRAGVGCCNGSVVEFSGAETPT